MGREYDVVILGGGTGGYVSAIRAAQLGLKTALVEKEKLGGTCLHKGCIPSKALLKSAEVFNLAKNESAKFGVNVREVTLDFTQVQTRKEEITARLYQGVQSLIKKGEIDLFNGTGRMLGPSIFSPMPGTISVEMNHKEENEMLALKQLVIATGSRPRPLEGLAFDEQMILSSEGALEMDSLPKTMAIVGGGAIGIEWASLLNDFGVEVTVIERQDRILPTEDEDISKEMKKLLERKGVTILTEAKILPKKMERKEDEVTVAVEVDDVLQKFTVEKVLVSIGRQANIEGIGLENTEIEVKNGCILTNSIFQTKEAHIYAIGDVIGGLQLAHVASAEGIAAIEHIAGEESQPLSESIMPRCIYTNPEVASLGLTEQQAREQGNDVLVGKFPFSAIGKSFVNGSSDGFVKVIADQETDDLLGVHMIGSHVTELISEAGLAMVLDATPWEIASTIHPHPSLSEVIGEAALAVDNKAIHI